MSTIVIHVWLSLCIRSNLSFSQIYYLTDSCQFESLTLVARSRCYCLSLKLYLAIQIFVSMYVCAHDLFMLLNEFDALLLILSGVLLTLAVELMNSH